ncbi:MAG: serine/threonine protein kinase [Planctomycetes bacterium]|nr:serine/threonine protein kinase [Planctomycetota bacterium]
MSRKRIYGLAPDQVGRLLSLGTDCADARSDQGQTQDNEPEPEQAHIERTGTWVGRYQILRLLGEGGMGVVYLAQQTHPIQRQVALKLIKPGMDSKRIIARFEAERQALALLDHPNIAHVLDAGTTEDQHPYFVMEHVDGLPVTEFCDRHTLGIKERLSLFQQICQGLQHAHQKGLIHRDIKPSNILISEQADQAIPKIIDFGVAKAVGEPLTDRTVYTVDTHLLGTPEYMSPEQTDMAGEDVDTRSDIYSLGVLLYVLLTGALPFDSKTLRKSGIEQVRKMIREIDPKTPSTRLIKLGDEAKKIAESRRTEVGALARCLHKELEWIPLKAMRKERSQRYRSASELSDDIENYLKGAPLIAAPPTAGYRLSKFLRRHKALVSGIAAVLIVSVIGTIVSVTFALGQADALAKAERIADFLQNDVLNAIAQKRDHEVTAHDILEVMSKNLEVKFKDYPFVEASIRGELSSIYTWGLNDCKTALVHTERAHRIYQEHGRDVHGDNTLGVTYTGLGRYKEAESVYDRLLEAARRKGEGELRLTFGKCNLALVYFYQGRYEEAEDLFVETWEIAVQGNHEDWVLNYECNLAWVYAAQDKNSDAERLYRAGISRSKPEDGQYALWHMCGLGELRTVQGRYAEANDLLVKACTIGRKQFGDAHPYTLEFINSFAVLRREQKQYEEAETLFLEALNGRRTKRDEDHPDTLETKNDLAVLLQVQDRYEEAEPLLIDAVDGRRLKLGDQHPHTLDSLNNLIDLYQAWGKPEKVKEWRSKRSAISYRKELTTDEGK